jgi:hypothetical protein
MIIYSPLDGEVLTTGITSRPRCCFLMTQLGDPVPEEVEAIRRSVSDLCRDGGYEVIDARTQVTGRDFLLKIWRMIASSTTSSVLLDDAGLDDRAKNSVEQLAAAF